MTRARARSRSTTSRNTPVPAPVVVNLDPPAAHVATADDAEGRTRIHTQWTARLASPADAELLRVPQGTVIFHILRTITDANGDVVKATTTLCPAARTVLHHSYPIPTKR
jgi:hypothetical protein